MTCDQLRQIWRDAADEHLSNTVADAWGHWFFCRACNAYGERIHLPPRMVSETNPEIRVEIRKWFEKHPDLDRGFFA